MNKDIYLARQAERLSSKWGVRLDEFHLPCPVCRGRLVFQGVNRGKIFEFAEGEPGVVTPLDVLPMSFVCDRCGYVAEFDSDLFNPSYLAELQGADPERIAQLEISDFRILVPLTCDEKGDTLLDLASALAYERHGEIIALNISPDNGGADRLMARIEAYEPPTGKTVPIRLLHHRSAGSVGERIVEVAAEQSVDLVLVGWRGPTRLDYAVMGRVLDPILNEAICDVVAVRDRGLPKVRRILLPTAGGPNAVAAAPLALDFARALDAELHLLTIVPTGTPEAAGHEQAEQTLSHMQQREDDRIETRVITADDLVEAIVGETAAYDLVFIGATPRTWRQHIRYDSIGSRIARNSGTTTLVVRGRQSLVTSWYHGLARLAGSLFGKRG